jgi:hypothetical protein
MKLKVNNTGAAAKSSKLFNLRTLEGILAIFVAFILLKSLVLGLFLPSMADEAVHIHEAYLTSQGLRPDLDFHFLYHPLRNYIYAGLLSLGGSPYLFIILIRILNLCLLVFLAFLINRLYNRFTGLNSRLPGLIFILGSAYSSFAMHLGQAKPDFLAWLFLVFALIYLHKYLTQSEKAGSGSRGSLIIASIFAALSGMTSSKIIFPLIGITLWLMYQNRKKGIARILSDSLLLNLPLTIAFFTYVSLSGGLALYIFNHATLMSENSPLNMGIMNLAIDSFREAVQNPFFVLFLLLTLYLLFFERKKLFGASRRLTLSLVIFFALSQLCGNLLISLRVGYLIPLLIPLGLLITPYLQKLEPAAEKRLIALSVLAFVFFLIWMGYIHLLIFRYILDPTDHSSGYKTIFEQAKDYSCLNITSSDYYFGFYSFFFHPIFVKDAGYYYGSTRVDKIQNYESLTEDSIKRATLIINPPIVGGMNPSSQIISSISKYSGYVSDNFEPVCSGIYLRRKTG